MARTSKQAQLLLEKGVRSGLEEVITEYLGKNGVGFEYEPLALPYEPPVKVRHYTFDWLLENGIIIEGKGKFPTEDRQKMLAVKKQYPALDIRFVFSNSRTTLTTQKNTEFHAWARRRGIKIPRTGLARDALKVEFFDHLRAQGKRPPSRTTYGDWALKHGFPFADNLPPVEWLREPPNEASLRALKEISK
jgi:hypothetical protein